MPTPVPISPATRTDAPREPSAAEPPLPLAAQGWLDAAAMGRALRRERARSSRRGSPFGVLVVRGRAAGVLREDYGELLSRSETLRPFDRLGWLDGEAAAVLLPERPVVEQQACAAELTRLLAERRCDPRVEIRVPFGHEAGGERGAGPFAPRPADALFGRRPGFAKRAFDVAAASVALAALLPLLTVLGVLIRLTSRGPALFRQERTGVGGRPFSMLKLRTMARGAEAMQAELRAENEQDGPAFKMQHDPRVTPLGALLRRSCVDELPQLWNVLRGEMSLVGPRPLPTAEMDRCEPWQRERLDAAPGLTCYWQVNKSLAMPFAEWMRSDIRYVRRRGFAVDAALLARTVVAVARMAADALRRKPTGGAPATGRATGDCRGG